VASTKTTRAERTLATRRRMVIGAYRRFCAEGYAGTTMNAIAQEAGVAVQTLYYTFHTKAALLGDAIGAAIIGFDIWYPPPPEPIGLAELKAATPWWQLIEDATTAAEALDVFISAGVPILERMGPLMGAMHGSAGDPDAEFVVAIAEDRRIAMYREVARAVARKPGGLRDGLTATAAADLLIVLFSGETYQALSVGRGWSKPRCAEFFRGLLTSQLLA
jgi:AcrR family transcriptional regulator